MADTTPLFVLQQPDTFEWPVKVPVPMDGTYRFAEFIGVFPNLTEDQVQALMPVVKGKPQRTDAAIASEILLGFKGVMTPQGTELPFTPENKAALLAGQRVANAVMGTFLLAVRGLAAEKNS